MSVMYKKFAKKISASVIIMGSLLPKVLKITVIKTILLLIIIIILTEGTQQRINKKTRCDCVGVDMGSL